MIVHGPAQPDRLALQVRRPVHVAALPDAEPERPQRVCRVPRRLASILAQRDRAPPGLLGVGLTEQELQRDEVGQALRDQLLLLTNLEAGGQRFFENGARFGPVPQKVCAIAELLFGELAAQQAVVLAKACPNLGRLVALGQPSGPELRQGLDHAVARPATVGVAFPAQHRLVDQTREQVHDVLARDAGPGTHRLGVGDIETALEDGQPRPRGLLLRRAELVAPVNERIEPALTRMRGAEPPAVVPRVQNLNTTTAPRMSMLGRTERGTPAGVKKRSSQ